MTSGFKGSDTMEHLPLAARELGNQHQTQKLSMVSRGTVYRVNHPTGPRISFPNIPIPKLEDKIWDESWGTTTRRGCRINYRVWEEDNHPPWSHSQTPYWYRVWDLLAMARSHTGTGSGTCLPWPDPILVQGLGMRHLRTIVGPVM